MARLGIAGGSGGMGTDSVSVPRSIIDQYEELKSWPDDKIEAELQAPTGLAPEYLVFSEARRRIDMRQRYENEAAGQDLPQVSMVEELLGGGQPGPPQDVPPPPGGFQLGEQALPGGGGPPMMDPMMMQGGPPMMPPGAPPMMDPMMMPQGESRGDLMPPPGYAGGGLLGRPGYAIGGRAGYSIYGDEEERPMEAAWGIPLAIGSAASRVPWGRVASGLGTAGWYGHLFGSDTDEPKLEDDGSIMRDPDTNEIIYKSPFDAGTTTENVAQIGIGAIPALQTMKAAPGAALGLWNWGPYRQAQSAIGRGLNKIPFIRRRLAQGAAGRHPAGTASGGQYRTVDPQVAGATVLRPGVILPGAAAALYASGSTMFDREERPDKDKTAEEVAAVAETTGDGDGKPGEVEKTEDYIKFLKSQFGKPDKSLALAMIEAGGTMANTVGPPISAITAGLKSGVGVYTESQQSTHKNKLASALALQEDAREYEKLDAAERQATTKMRFKAASDMEESLYKMISTSGQGAEVLRPMMDSNAKWMKTHPDGGSVSEFIEFMKNQAYWFNAGSPETPTHHGPMVASASGTTGSTPLSDIRLRGAYKPTGQQGGLVRGRSFV